MNPFQAIYNLIRHVATPPAILASILIPVAYVVSSAFINPQGALNTFLIKVIDMIFLFWPSTPTHMQIGYLLNQFALQFPALGMGLVYEIMAGVGGILLLVMFFKLIKIIPFI